MRIRMEDVVSDLNLIPRITGPTMDIECPNCGNNCLHFDFGQQVFACPVCAETDGVGEGVIDAWAFFREIKGGTKKETRSLAKRDIDKFYGKNPEVKRTYKKKTEYVRPVEIASEDKRDEFFRKILSVLNLNFKHRKNLLERGMTEEQIERSLIKSFRQIPSRELEKMFSCQDISNFPGFYMENGKPCMVDYGSGMLIPEISIDGKIQGFQIRRDTQNKKKRYITLSSAKYGGTKGPTFVHYANWEKVPVDTCIITEGPLKGAIINYFTGMPVLAIPGVSSQKYLFEALEKLKSRGLKKVKIAFDMDFYEKETVQKALASLRKKLSDLEIPFTQLTWKSGEKGYDDHLAKKASE